MKRFDSKRIFVLICLNAGLYIPVTAIDIMDASGGLTAFQGHLCDVLKYASIVSCFLISLFSLLRCHAESEYERKRAARGQTIVFAFTLAADFFLLFTPFFTVGVLIFLGAHISAIARYKPGLTLYAGGGAAALFFIVLAVTPKALHADHELALLLAACFAYGALIITATTSAFRAVQPRGNALCSRIGMLLFLACDINVAVFNALPAGSLPHTAATALMWIFYLPAQTLLAISSAQMNTAPKSKMRGIIEPDDTAL